MSDEEPFGDEQPEDIFEDVADEPEHEAPEQRNGHRKRGPGILLGIIAGTVAGAAAAVLLAPSEAEELPEGAAASPLDRLRAVLRDASREAGEAAREKEAEMRSRYEELTR